MILVSCCFLVSSISVEEVEVFSVPELFVAEFNPGHDDYGNEDDAYDDHHPLSGPVCYSMASFHETVLVEEIGGCHEIDTSLEPHH